MSKSLEALENIAITFDEMGFVPTTLNPFDGIHFIDWLKQNLNFKIEKHKSCPNCMFVSYKDLQEWLEPSNEMADLLKEVLE